MQATLTKDIGFLIGVHPNATNITKLEEELRNQLDRKLKKKTDLTISPRTTKFGNENPIATYTLRILTAADGHEDVIEGLKDMQSEYAMPQKCTFISWRLPWIVGVQEIRKMLLHHDSIIQTTSIMSYYAGEATEIKDKLIETIKKNRLYIKSANGPTESRC